MSYESLKTFSRIFHERFKVVSRKIKGCFKGIVRGFKGI